MAFCLFFIIRHKILVCRFHFLQSRIQLFDLLCRLDNFPASLIKYIDFDLFVLNLLPVECIVLCGLDSSIPYRFHVTLRFINRIDKLIDRFLKFNKSIIPLRVQVSFTMFSCCFFLQLIFQLTKISHALFHTSNSSAELVRNQLRSNLSVRVFHFIFVELFVLFVIYVNLFGSLCGNISDIQLQLDTRYQYIDGSLKHLPDGGNRPSSMPLYK